MKDFTDISDKLLDTDELIKHGSETFINNVGKIIAVIAALISIAATFTDISFTPIFSISFASSLLLILSMGYIIYFSLEEAGEVSGKNTEEYKAALSRYVAARERIRGEDIEDLREFCRAYAEDERVARQNGALTSLGLSRSDLDRYLSGESLPRGQKRQLKKIASIKLSPLTPKILLAREKPERYSELENPERKKLSRLSVKLIPTTVSAFVTVSVVLTANTGMGGADILSAILRLSTLPVLAFRGFSEGYTYAKHSLSLWLETKANVLSAFLESGKLKMESGQLKVDN